MRNKMTLEILNPLFAGSCRINSLLIPPRIWGNFAKINPLIKVKSRFVVPSSSGRCFLNVPAPKRGSHKVLNLVSRRPTKGAHFTPEAASAAEADYFHPSMCFLQGLYQSQTTLSPRYQTIHGLSTVGYNHPYRRNPCRHSTSSYIMDLRKHFGAVNPRKWAIL